MKNFTTLGVLCLLSVAAGAKEKWQVTGDFSYGVETRQLLMVAYEDGTYTIQDWMGEEGFDIEFSVNESNNTIHILNGEPFNEFIQVKANDTREIPMYQDVGAFYGTQTRGYVLLVSEYQSNIRFEWPVKSWSTEGTMTVTDTNDFENSYNCTITAYANETYAISSWYDTPGYNIEFSVNADGTLNILNGYTIGEGSDNVTTVTASETSTKKIYQNSESSFEGEQESGKLMFTGVAGENFVFEWPANVDGAVSRVYGTLSYPQGNDRVDRKVEMVLFEDGVYSLVNWYTDGYNLDFKVNKDKTLHFIGGTSMGEYQIIPYADSPDVAGYSFNGWFYQDCKSGFEENAQGGELWFNESQMCDKADAESEKITFVWEKSGVDEIADSAESFSVVAGPDYIVVPTGATVYNTSGIPVNPARLAKGIYIVVYGRQNVKIVL